MKILIVIDHFPPDIKGGYEIRCEEACNWLFNNGYEIEVITTKSKYTNNKSLFPVHRILTKYPFGETPKTWSFIKKIRLALIDNILFKKTLKKINPKKIYIWNCASFSRSLLPIIFSTKIPKIIDVSSNWLRKIYFQRGPIYNQLYSDSYNSKIFILNYLVYVRKFIFFFSLKNFEQEYFINLNNVQGYFTSNWNKRYHESKIVHCSSFYVFHTGVHLNSFPFRLKNKINEKKIKFLFIGSISKAKGFLLLLGYLKDLIKKWNVNLKVVGNFISKKEMNVITTYIDKFGLNECVEFLGQVERNNLHKYFHDTDLTVFPSIWDEPFSRVPLESLSCGTPCISTKNPGSLELFELGAPLLELDTNENNLFDILHLLMRDEKYYKRISKDGRSFIEKQFTFNRFMKKVDNLIVNN